MDKAIEAAAEAMARHEIDDYGQRDVEIYIPLATVAISAYQAASGEARDAKRYNALVESGAFTEGRFPSCPWALRRNGPRARKDELDAAIDAAIAVREGVNDGQC